MNREDRPIRNLVFYGDSNTYGYDPADFYENRYPACRRWTTIVSEALQDSFRVFAEGMNGRTIPDITRSRGYLARLIEKVKDDGILCTILGTNDILAVMHPDASTAVRKMEQYIHFLLQYLRPEQILIIAPPPSGKEDSADPFWRAAFSESLKMNRGFRLLAAEYGAHFADAAEWDISLSYDLVHFSEAGHQIFAREMISLIRTL